MVVTSLMDRAIRTLQAAVVILKEVQRIRVQYNPSHSKGTLIFILKYAGSVATEKREQMVKLINQPRLPTVLQAILPTPRATPKGARKHE